MAALALPKRCEENAFAADQDSLLEEVIWLEPALALLRNKTKEKWTEKHRRLQEIWFWKEAGCSKDYSTLVGRMRVSAKLVTKRTAQKSTGSTTAQKGTKSDEGFQRHSESGSKKPKLQRKSGSGKEVSSRTLSVKANGTGVISV